MARGCGSRIQGDVYATLPLGPGGSPVEDFLFDPPIPVDAEALGVKPRGVKYVQGPDGVTHVLDWVGADNYPNAADFVEEVRTMGMSRKIPKNMDFGLLEPGSRLVVLHPRGYLKNWLEYWRYAGENGSGCPKRKPEHPTSEALRSLGGAYVGDPPDRDWLWTSMGDPEPPPDLEHCLGLLYGAVSGGEPQMYEWPGGGTTETRNVVRVTPGAVYPAMKSPPDLKPDFTLAMIASFPIVQLDVIEAEDGSHEHGISVASTSKLPVSVQPE